MAKRVPKTKGGVPKKYVAGSKNKKSVGVNSQLIDNRPHTFTVKIKS